MKEKKFFASPKRYIVFMVILYVLYTLGLLYGLKVYHKLPRIDPFKTPLLFALAGAGALLLIGSLSALFLNMKKVVVFTPKNIEYKHGNKEFSVLWRDLTFKISGGERSLYRTAIISDGRNFGTIDNLFFPEYDLMIKVIDKAKEKDDYSTMVI
ncbi:MAG: hypothetical protein RDV48_18175 [Candidatus Eremiobacteraeota bacterium]|nr:hypothetical protein [Candidatus Eremiobacteraeota bacterium]